MATKRTTLVIDEALLQKARQALGTSGIRETVEASLKETVRRKTLDEFREAIRLGTIHLDLTLEELLKHREAE